MLFIGPCGKKTYLTKDDAQAALDKMERIRQVRAKRRTKYKKKYGYGKRRECAMYHCKKCEGYHLTSQKQYANKVRTRSGKSGKGTS